MGISDNYENYFENYKMKRLRPVRYKHVTTNRIGITNRNYEISIPKDV